MVPCLGGSIRQEVDGGLVLQEHPRALCVDPGFELTAFAKLIAIEERPPIDGYGGSPLSGANRIVELPNVGAREIRVEPQLLARREY